MTSWMITGAGKQQPTKWGGGSIACKTAFKSRVVQKNASGKTITPVPVDGQLTFNEVNPGDSLEYTVFTGADGTKGKSDNFYLLLTSLNWPYLINLTNEIYSKASAQQLARWKQHNSTYKKYLISKINPALFFVTYSSEILQSDDSGNYTGTMKIGENIPSGLMTVDLIYGYNDDAKSSDASRAWSNIYDVATYVTIAIEFLVCPFTLGATCATAMMHLSIAELGKLAYDHLSKGLSAGVGRNKYGCSFPDGGFVHVYGVNLVNPNNDPFQMVDTEQMEELSSNGVGFFDKKMLFIALSLGGLFVLLDSVSKGGD